MKETNLYIDESGNLGIGGRYFLICAIELRNSVNKSLSKRAGRTINRFKSKYGIPKTKEIKGFNLNYEKRVELLNKILFREVRVRYIVLDLKQTTMLLTKADDKNACYNYLVQLLVKRIISENKHLVRVNLFLDNRSVKIGNRLSLKPYLYNKLVLENLETDTFVNRIDFNINYFESESCYLIQWADILANSLFKKYNSDISDFYDIIKPFIVYESKFPSKTFGK